MKLTIRQQFFIESVLAGKNIFLTGKAGTGKSFAIKEAIRRLKKQVLAVAPTGVAASNIDGVTIHSQFGLTPHGVLSFDTCNFLKPAKREVLQRAETIIFDEVSMLRPDVLDGVHWTLKKNGLSGLHTKQVIFVGDLKQLPSIVNDNMRSVMFETYNGTEFTDAKIFSRLNVVTIELDEVLRQDNPELIEALNVVRDGGRSEYFRQFVGKEQRGVVLAPYNTTVQEYNVAGLRAQQGELLTFTAEIQGNAKAQDFALDQVIEVKNGCKIMYLVNSQDNPLRNGTIGIFVSHAGCHYIRVGNVDYALNSVMITKKEYIYNKELDKLELQEIGSITQYPFRLAYALSIHKSQGLAFDEVTLDLRRPCFIKGQMYTALSRVKSPQGLTIIV